MFCGKMNKSKNNNKSHKGYRMNNKNQWKCSFICLYVSIQRTAYNSNSSHSLLFCLLCSQVGQPDYETYLKENQCLAQSNQNTVLNASDLNISSHLFIHNWVCAVLCVVPVCAYFKNDNPQFVDLIGDACSRFNWLFVHDLFVMCTNKRMKLALEQHLVICHSISICSGVIPMNLSGYINWNRWTAKWCTLIYYIMQNVWRFFSPFNFFYPLICIKICWFLFSKLTSGPKIEILSEFISHIHNDIFYWKLTIYKCSIRSCTLLDEHLLLKCADLFAPLNLSI